MGLYSNYIHEAQISLNEASIKEIFTNIKNKIISVINNFISKCKAKLAKKPDSKTKNFFTKILDKLYNLINKTKNADSKEELKEYSEEFSDIQQEVINFAVEAKKQDMKEEYTNHNDLDSAIKDLNDIKSQVIDNIQQRHDVFNQLLNNMTNDIKSQVIYNKTKSENDEALDDINAALDNLLSND